MHTNRIDRIVSEMRREGVGQLLVSDPLVVYYLTGIRIVPGERMLVLLLRDDGSHKLFVNALFRQTDDKGADIVYITDTDDGPAELFRYMTPGGTVAVDKNWPARFLLRLIALDPDAAFINSASIVDGVRRIKEPEEQALMREASARCDKVMAELIPLVAVGKSETELDAVVRRLFAEHGCPTVSFDPITAFAKNAADPHHATDGTRGRYGDCVVLDIGGMYQDYCSDMTRTVFLGEISPRQKEIYSIVLEANLRGIAAARPGARMCDVDAACRDHIASKGFGPYFTHRTGHSIGLEDHETGDVSSVNTDIIRPGQVFSVEPGIYLPDEGIGVRIEDLVLITETGCEVLNSYPKDIIVLPAEK